MTDPISAHSTDLRSTDLLFLQAAQSKSAAAIKRCAQLVSQRYCESNSLQTIQSAIQIFFLNAPLSNRTDNSPSCQEIFFNGLDWNYNKVLSLKIIEILPLDLAELDLSPRPVECLAECLAETTQRLFKLNRLSIDIYELQRTNQCERLTSIHSLTLLTDLSITLAIKLNSKELDFPEPLKHFSQLHSLCVRYPTNQAVEHIKYCTNLTDLKIHSIEGGLESLGHLSKLTNLVSFTAYQTDAAPIGNTIVSRIKSWTTLTSLQLLAIQGLLPESLATLTSLSKLHFLSLRSCRELYYGPYLLAFSSLKELNVWNTDISHEDLRKLMPASVKIL